MKTGKNPKKPAGSVNLRKPPLFVNKHNVCSSTVVYQILIACLLKLGCLTKAPSPTIPSEQLRKVRRSRGIQENDFETFFELGNAYEWLLRLIKNPVDEFTNGVKFHIGNPYQITQVRKFARGKSFFSTQNKDFCPVFNLSFNSSLEKSIQNKLNGFYYEGGNRRTGIVFDNIPSIIFVLPPLTDDGKIACELDFQVELDVYTKGNSIPHKINAQVCGFIREHPEHYTSVVHYGDRWDKGWWHINCAIPIRQEINIEKVHEMFKKDVFILALSCKENAV